MRSCQVERRKRTRHLIELGGLVVKAGVVDLAGDDRATIYGALLWTADKLKSDERERALALWAAKGSRRSRRNARARIAPPRRTIPMERDRWRAARRPTYRSAARHHTVCRATTAHITDSVFRAPRARLD